MITTIKSVTNVTSELNRFDPGTTDILSSLTIGEVRLGGDLTASNISTVAARFAIKSGLDNRLPRAGKGTEVNALRHAIWQSIISSKFGEDIAKKAGYPHEENRSVNRGVTDFSNIVFTSLTAADQSADLANNVIGREIGAANKGLSNQQLALRALEYFHDKGYGWQ